MNEKKAIVDWLEQQQINNYSINDDLSVDVNGNVDISKRKLTHIPIQFNHVTGYFDCRENNLKSLKGSPLYIDDDFYMEKNQLTDLKYSPLKVSGSFYCSHNKLVTLEGCTQEIGAYFSCEHNLLISLKGGPISVYNDYTASYNPNLVSFDGCPKEVGEDFILLHCPFNDDLKNFTSHFKEVVFSNHKIKGIENHKIEINFSYEGLQAEKKKIFSEQLYNTLHYKEKRTIKIKI